MIAVDNGFSPKTVEKLIELGCDVDAQDADGNTALHTTVYTENFKLFQCLIASGANPLKTDNDGLDTKSLCIE